MTQTSPLEVLSVTRVLPLPGNESQGVFVANRLRAMAALMNLSVVQPVPYFPLFKPMPKTASYDDGPLTRPPMFYVPGVMKSLDSWFLGRAVRPSIVSRMNQARIDMLDAHFGYPDGTAVVRLGRTLGIPAVVTLRGVENELLQTPGIRSQLRETVRNADGCICVSHFLARLALEAGAPEEKVRVIHNAVDRRRFAPGDRNAARDQLGLPSDRPLIVSVGHQVARKGHHILLDAVAELRKSIGDVTVVIIGREAERRYAALLSSKVEEHGLERHVRFLGNLAPDSIPAYLQAADVFALMTNREGCCNAVLEALACGVPVVTTDAGDNAYFVKDGINGRITSRAAGACADALKEIIDRPISPGADVSASLDVGDWHSVAVKVESFFRDIVDGRST